MPAFKYSSRQLALAGIIAAIYAVLTLSLPILSYQGVQLRIAEAMTVLPFLCPAAAIPGLTVGCFLANLLGSPMVADWIFGTAATLVAAIWTSRLHNRYLAPLPPVICNAVIVGAAYGLNAFTVGLGELLACYVLGLPLLRWAERTPLLSLRER